MKKQNGIGRNNNCVKDLFGTVGGVAGLTRGKVKKHTKGNPLADVKSNSINKGGLSNLTRKAFPNMKV